MTFSRTPLGRAGRTFNFLVGATGIAVLVALTISTGPGPPPLLLAATFLGLFVFTRLMRFEIPPNITASLVVPLQIAAILLLGPIVTAWLAIPAFIVEALRARALT